MRYNWKPNRQAKIEYAENCKRREKLPVYTTTKAIRKGCKLTFYNVGLGQIVSGVVVHSSYGLKTGQHTFTIQKDDGTKLMVKGRNLYPNIISHEQGEQSKIESI